MTELSTQVRRVAEQATAVGDNNSAAIVGMDDRLLAAATELARRCDVQDKEDGRLQKEIDALKRWVDQ